MAERNIGAQKIFPRADDEYSKLLIDQIIKTLNAVLDGNLINTGSFTVTMSAATTTIKDSRVSGKSVILFMPKTASAATEIATLYVSERKLGEFTITHTNSATADRDFGYAFFG